MANRAPMKEHPQVVRLLEIMEKNQLSNLGDMVDMLDQVSAVEKQLSQAVAELADLRKALHTVQERQRPAVQKMVIAVQAQMLDLRDTLMKLKQAVAEGCRNAIRSFEQRGISALAHMSRFFKIRPLLESARQQASNCLDSLEKLEACAKTNAKPSLKETLEKNAQKSKEMFSGAQTHPKQKEASI